MNYETDILYTQEAFDGGGPPGILKSTRLPNKTYTLSDLFRGSMEGDLSETECEPQATFLVLPQQSESLVWHI